MSDQEWRSDAGAPGARDVGPESPWVGLRSFQEETSGYFFGRLAEMYTLADRVLHRPLTVVYGQSGLGKTSLLRAGLMPLLRCRQLVPVRIRLEHDASAGTLESQVIGEVARQVPGLAEQTRSDDSGLWELFHDVRTVPLLSAATPVLIFDQFEEIWTQGRVKRPADADAFMEALAALVEGRPPQRVRERIERDEGWAERFPAAGARVRVVLSLREDYLHWLERWREQMPSMMENRFELRPLGGPQAREAVLGPARLRCQGKTPLPPILDEATADAIVRLAAGAAEKVPLEEIEAVPPLLSLLCEQLNERRLRDGEATIRIGSLADAAPDVLTEFYERTLSRFPTAVREFIEAKLLSEAGLREAVSWDGAEAELRRSGVADATAVLRKLVDLRLLTVEQRGEQARVELTHDVLAPIAARSRDARLSTLALRADEERHATESRARLRRRMTVTVVGLLGIAAACGWVAAWQGMEAARLSKEAKRLSEELVEEQNKVRDEQDRAKKELLRRGSMAAHASALRLVRDLYGRESRIRMEGRQMADGSTGGAGKWCEAVAHWAQGLELDPGNRIAGQGLLAALRNGGQRVLSVPTAVIAIPGTPPDTIVLNADGDSLAVRQSEGIVVYRREQDAGWQPSPTARMTLPDGTAPAEFWGFDFDAGGSRLVGVRGDRADVWHCASGRILGTCEHGCRVTAARLSADGRGLFTRTEDGNGHLWDPSTGTRLAEPFPDGKSGANYAMRGSPEVADPAGTFLTVSPPADDAEGMWKVLLRDGRTAQERACVLESRLPIQSVSVGHDARVLVITKEELPSEVPVQPAPAAPVAPVVPTSGKQRAAGMMRVQPAVLRDDAGGLPDAQKQEASGQSQTEEKLDGYAYVIDLKSRDQALPLAKAGDWSAGWLPGREVILQSPKPGEADCGGGLSRLIFMRTNSGTASPALEETFMVSLPKLRDEPAMWGSMLLAHSANDGLLRVWNVRDGEELSHLGLVNAFAASTASRTCVTVDVSGDVTIWKTVNPVTSSWVNQAPASAESVVGVTRVKGQAKDEVCCVEKHKRDPACHMRAVADGRSMPFVAFRVAAERLIRVPGGPRGHVVSESRHSEPVRLAIAKLGGDDTEVGIVTTTNTMVMAQRDGRVVTVNLDTGGRQDFGPVPAVDRVLAVTADARVAVVIHRGAEGTRDVLLIRSADEVGIAKLEHEEDVAEAEFDPTGRFLVTRAAEACRGLGVIQDTEDISDPRPPDPEPHTLRVWRLGAEPALAWTPIEGVTLHGFSSDGNRLFVVRNGWMHVFDTSTGAVCADPCQVPDGTFSACFGATDDTIHVVSTVAAVDPGHGGEATRVYTWTNAGLLSRDTALSVPVPATVWKMAMAVAGLSFDEEGTLSRLDEKNRVKLWSESVDLPEPWSSTLKCFGLGK